MIYVLNFRDSIPLNYSVVNTTSRSNTWSKDLSPMIVGPVYANGIKCENVENAWQFSKVYHEHVDENNEPTTDYFAWRDKGYKSNWAERYPMGKGRIPLYSYWNGNQLDYIQARKDIYIPLYADAVIKTDVFKQLKALYQSNNNLILLDFDAYNHRDLNMTWDQVIHNKDKKMGHAFVLAMLLEGVI